MSITLRQNTVAFEYRVKSLHRDLLITLHKRRIEIDIFLREKFHEKEGTINDGFPLHLRLPID